MNNTLLQLAYFILLTPFLSAQESAKYSTENTIALRYYWYHPVHPPATETLYIFDENGKIMQIDGGHFPFKRYKPLEIKYVADYFYDKNGKLKEELVFEVTNDTSYLFRHSAYIYMENCRKVLVHSGQEELLLGEIEECLDEGSMTRNYYEDLLAPGEPNLLHGSEVNWYLNGDGSIKNIQLNGVYKDSASDEILDQPFKIEYGFEYHRKFTKISSRWENADTVFSESVTYRFYDRKKRLKKKTASIHKRDYKTKFQYDKLGFISQISKEGYSINPYKKQDQNFKVKCEISQTMLTKIKRKPDLVRKINEEFLNMRFPVTGSGMGLYYMDSRRY